MTFRSLIPHRPARAVWPPRELRSGFADLFDEMWRDFGALAPVTGGGVAPRVNIEETDDEIRVTAELPGVEEKDIEVTLEEDVLTIKGEKRSGYDERCESSTRVERRSGSFQRCFRIPWEIDPEAVEAAYKHGVLSVRLPKPADTRSEPRTIPVMSS